MSTVSAWEWAVVFMIGPYKTGSTIKRNRWVMRMIVSWWKKLPVEEWDIPLPAVVTPSKVWEW
ncbi:putative ligase [Escherichia coli]|uniref:Putative ligase n=1 Tax=Escherichia coli TaxID=562 RepID=A0A2X3LPZ4_ECOLX|nr:putative ligase [Escherichia coli]